MFCRVQSAALCGIQAKMIHVEADVGDGLPLFLMVGYLTSQVKEAQERVKTAMKNSGFSLDPKKVTVNLSPADLRKEGSGFDLPIAVAVLAAYGYIPQEALEKTLIAGELSLNGEVCPIRGVLPMVGQAAAEECSRCIVPKGNEREGALIQGIQVIGVSSLGEVVSYLNGGVKLLPVRTNLSNIEEILSENQESPENDFAMIHGQEPLRRAAEVAVAGMHNLLMVGPPGSGKSMTAKCVPGILPKLTLEESLEISTIYSVAGLLLPDRPLAGTRPFRAPHHTISPQALAGGGRIPRPGEVSLAHRGVLFLDELPEFRRESLEILRQPLEERQVCISRLSGSFHYPADSMLVAAMNPCKCGYYPDRQRCTCTRAQIRQYQGKISQPLLDRIDLCVGTQEIAYETLTSERKEESSAEIRTRVTAAHKVQMARYEKEGIHFNSQLTVDGIRKYCRLGREENQLMEEAYDRLKLSARGYHRILRVARTIADLDGSKEIKTAHLGEAIGYRGLERSQMG